MGFIAELSKLGPLGIETSDNIETAAYKTAVSNDRAVRHSAVQLGAQQATVKDGAALQYLAWLLVYDTVTPLLILQVVSYTKETGFITICGTSRFEKDSIEHLKLPESPGATPAFHLEKPVSTVDIDLIAEADHAQIPAKAAHGEASSSEPTNLGDTPIPPGKLVRDHARISGAGALMERKRLQDRVKEVLMGSMSADEIAHKLSNLQTKAAQSEVSDTILHVAMDEKSYNRLYGNVAYKLGQQSAKWSGAFEVNFSRIFRRESEDLNTNQLKIVGTLFGHLLSINGVHWEPILSAMTLNPDQSTPSNRIMLEAVVREAGEELGKTKLQTKLTNPDLKRATRDLFTGEFAAHFWEAIGFEDLASYVTDANQ